MAGVVKVITATQSRIGKITDGVKRVVLRVCAYCRVSTDNEEQQTSYKSQKTHYKTLKNTQTGSSLIYMLMKG